MASDHAASAMQARPSRRYPLGQLGANCVVNDAENFGYVTFEVCIVTAMDGAWEPEWLGCANKS